MRHPGWCARGHRCGLGEHRSVPVALPGGLVLVLVEAAGGRWVEFRGSARLTSADQAMQLVAALDLARRAVELGEVELLAPMIERVSARR